MKIDFYHIDAMEAPHYEPIWRELVSMGIDARLVAVPGGRNTALKGWFDFERLAAYYLERNIPYHTDIRPSAHAVTTQNADILRNYKGSRIRLMYGPMVYPDAWGLSEKSVRPFDAVLVHGQRYVDLFSRWKPVKDLVIIGYPRYDDYFSGKINATSVCERWHLNSSKSTLAYLPTWGNNSAFDRFTDAVSELVFDYNVLIKPHHCTLRMEPERMHKLSESGCVVITSSFDLACLYMVADIVLTDARSSVLCEALILDRNVCALLLDNAELDNWIKAQGVLDLAMVCEKPISLKSTLKEHGKWTRENDKKIESWISSHVALRNGCSAKFAAQAIVDHLVELPAKRHFLSGFSIPFFR